MCKRLGYIPQSVWRKFSAPARKKALSSYPSCRLLVRGWAIPVRSIFISSFNLFSFTEKYVKSQEQYFVE
jgi:hypothetical protein